MAEFRSICKEANIDDFDLFKAGVQMMSEYEWKKLQLSIIQMEFYTTSDISTIPTNRKATKRYLEQINAAAKLSSTLNESLNKLREKLKGEEKDDF